MTFQFRPDESVRKGVKRLVRKQIDNALQGLRSRGGSDRVVHDARKRFKRVRALLRLARAASGEKAYRKENTCFRDAGRPLTEIRDAKVLVETLDGLTAHFAGRVTARTFTKVRDALLADKKAVRKEVLKERDALTGVIAAVEAARRRLVACPFGGKGSSTLYRGLKRSYRNVCRAFAAASADPGVEQFHEWRKQAKYLWHQLQVIEPAWQPLLKQLGDEVHAVTHFLGDDHDLAVLRDKVVAHPDTFGGAGVVETLVALVDKRRDELEQEAIRLGRRLFSDKPSRLAKRIQGYWKAWQSEQSTTDRVSV